MVPSSIENVREKGSEEVPYSNEQSTHTIGDDGFRFYMQAKKIDCYASLTGLTGMVSLCISTSILLEIFHESDEVEDIMLQVSTFVTSAICDGDTSEKVLIREESLKRPTPCSEEIAEVCELTEHFQLPMN